MDPTLDERVAHRAAQQRALLTRQGERRRLRALLVETEAYLAGVTAGGLQWPVGEALHSRIVALLRETATADELQREGE